MKNLEKSLKALANKRRLAIIKYLKTKREASVGEIADSIKLSLRSTSKHLSILSSADVVEKDQRGLQIFYRLNSRPAPVVSKVISLV